MSLFKVSQPFLLFDYFRIPYTIEGSNMHVGGGTASLGVVRPSDGSNRVLLWPEPTVEERAGKLAGGRVTGAFVLDTTPVFGRFVNDATARMWLDELGGSWYPSTPISDQKGRRVASIWHNDDRGVFLPFDPGELIASYWEERYLDYVDAALSRALRSGARTIYYRLRGAIPRNAQIATRRLYSRVQAKQRFPRWPIETGLHDLYHLLLGVVAGLIDEPLPGVAPWPRGYSWAFVLTHDIETAGGYDNISLLRDIELRAEYRSAWNFVPRNHHVVADGVFDDLRSGGFEIGVHGLYHDGRDIAEIDERMPLIRQYAKSWNSVGFRSPATLRDRNVMAKLPFDYDSTYSDTAPYEPQPGGCGSWLPYMIENIVELPITLPQDHTLFEILGGLDKTIWIDKARFIRNRGGMALVLTHPDYAENPHLVRAYEALLNEFADDDTAWKVLPRDISSWWRRRGASHLTRTGSGWTVTGPAADVGVVSLLGADE